MRKVLLGACSLAALAVVTGAAPGCGGDGGSSTFSSSGGDGSDAGGCTGFGCNDSGGGCVGLACKQVTCEGSTTTSLSGIVMDPAGKVPIYNATVYVPNGELAPLSTGASCDRCDAAVSGSPVAITATDTAGKFVLPNVPVTDNLPLVVQIGKWRRKVTIPAVTKCADTALPPALTRLPKNRTEGDIPRIALTTGGADPLQCLLRKIGLDDSEFGAAGSDARVHLYAGGGYTENSVSKPASAKFGASLGGAAFPAAQDLWSDANKLKAYDVVLMSCEGDPNETTKPDAAKQALYDYAKAGGRVFASHYHHVWFSGSPVAEVKAVASWATPEQAPPALPNPPATTAVQSDISGAFPKALAMKDWLGKQGALSNTGTLPIYDARHNVNSTNASALTWISVQNPNAMPAGPAVQYLSFNTPVGAADDAVCGRVVFSNLHVGAGQQGGVSDDPQAAFPDGCQTKDLSAQQKALEFMLFDLSSCVQKDDGAVAPPH